MKASEIRQLTAEELNTKLMTSRLSSLTSDSSSLLTSSKTRCASRRLRRTSLVLRQLSVRMSLAKRTHKGRED